MKRARSSNAFYFVEYIVITAQGLHCTFNCCSFYWHSIILYKEVIKEGRKKGERESDMTCCIAGITITHTDILLKCSMYRLTCGEHGLESL